METFDYFLRQVCDREELRAHIREFINTVALPNLFRDEFSIFLKALTDYAQSAEGTADVERIARSVDYSFVTPKCRLEENIFTAIIAQWPAIVSRTTLVRNAIANGIRHIVEAKRRIEEFRHPRH